MYKKIRLRLQSSLLLEKTSQRRRFSWDIGGAVSLMANGENSYKAYPEELTILKPTLRGK